MSTGPMLVPMQFRSICSQSQMTVDVDVEDLRAEVYMPLCPHRILYIKFTIPIFLSNANFNFSLRFNLLQLVVQIIFFISILYLVKSIVIARQKHFASRGSNAGAMRPPKIF